LSDLHHRASHPMSTIYDSEHRALQDEFQSRNLADRLEELIIKDHLDEQAIEFVSSRDFFFLSTVDQAGFPTVSHKGGDIGLVKVIDNKTLVFPYFDGNGMWLSMGNIAGQTKLGMLFIDMENPHRLRVQGTAKLVRDTEILSLWPEVGLAAQISITQTWINCPRYIHPVKRLNTAPHVPKVGEETPPAEWKSFEPITDVVPPFPHTFNKPKN